jgi:hypothetical protein
VPAAGKAETGTVLPPDAIPRKETARVAAPATPTPPPAVRPPTPPSAPKPPAPAAPKAAVPAGAKPPVGAPKAPAPVAKAAPVAAPVGAASGGMNDTLTIVFSAVALLASAASLLFLLEVI